MTESYANRSARGRAPTDDEAQLREALTAPDARTRGDAALGLVDRAGNDDLTAATIDGLAERVRNDDDASVRQFAVEALGVAGRSGDVTADAIRTALDDPTQWVRAEAVVALSRARPDEVDALRDVLDDESGFVRRNVVVALGKTGRGDPQTFAERLREDPHAGVREYAASFLPTVADDVEAAVTLLAAVLARDPEAHVRASAATALGDCGTDRAEEALERQGLPDRSDDVQRAAKRGLATARGVAPDELDVDVQQRAPGTGPDAPDERGPGRGGQSAPPERTSNGRTAPGPGPHTAGATPYDGTGPNRTVGPDRDRHPDLTKDGEDR